MLLTSRTKRYFNYVRVLKVPQAWNSNIKILVQTPIYSCQGIWMQSAGILSLPSSRLIPTDTEYTLLLRFLERTWNRPSVPRLLRSLLAYYLETNQYRSDHCRRKLPPTYDLSHSQYNDDAITSEPIMTVPSCRGLNAATCDPCSTSKTPPVVWCQSISIVCARLDVDQIVTGV
ncbi:hypothetical protein BDW69DRAFT_11294 [Aspergillus filifer]